MNVYPLRGVVQHYSWGGNSFIPSLLNIDNEGKKPFAEYWLGAHENAPSLVEGKDAVPLNEFIRSNPSVLGKEVVQKFGRLPYLLKVLDVRDMLSIQVHPSKTDAEQGFEAEEKAGIARNAPNRNYKDDNHKPELMLALGEFYLLHGFREAASLRSILQEVPELRNLVSVFGDNNYKALYEYVMNLPQETVNEELRPLLDRIIPAYRAGSLSKDHPDFWAARAAITFNEKDRIDRGIYSVYFFNVVKMKRGQAIFQDAGLPHAYLEGQNIEIMANSDNVLRGGLTTKYIDTKELIRHIHFEPTIPRILDPAPDPVSGERRFITPAADFELSEIVMRPGQSFQWNPASIEILFNYEGKVQVDELRVRRGEAVMAPAGKHLTIKATETGILYRAVVPYAQS